MNSRIETALTNLCRAKSALDALTRGGDGSDACTDIQNAIAIIAEDISRNLEILDGFCYAAREEA